MAPTPSVLEPDHFFYIVQSQHPLTSADDQVLPPIQPPRRPPPSPLPMMQPAYVPTPSPESLQPPWVKDLLAHKVPKKPVYVAPKPGITCAMIKKAEDALCVALLRAIDLIQKDGPVKAKLRLNRVGPPSELKEIIYSATDLAEACFELLPPFLACVNPRDVRVEAHGVESSFDYDMASTPLTANLAGLTAVPGMDSQILSSMAGAGSLSGPVGVAFHTGAATTGGGIGGAGMGSGGLPTSMAGMGAVTGMGPVAGMGTGQDQMMSPYEFGSGYGFAGWSEPPAGGMQPPAEMMSAPPMEWGAPYGNFFPPTFNPYGVQYHRLNEARRKCGFDGGDLFPSNKKGPAVGDRPLTPPAQGWYAKYSSGVTGVVWDRVHQAWVVSWTLAGKRTFRHFTCKSYGGFDKAREAAIEFRLARNREIAAYNKRCKDKK